MKSFLFILSLLCLVGCAEEAGEFVGEELNDFGAGIGAGVDKGMIVECDADDSLNEHGLEMTVAKQVSLTGLEGKRIQIYVISQDECYMTLRMQAYDESGNEVGRSKQICGFEEDGGQYVEFQFDERMDMNLVAKYGASVSGTMSEFEYEEYRAEVEAEEAAAAEAEEEAFESSEEESESGPGP